MKKLVVLLVFLALLFAYGCEKGGKGTPVATVNGVNILDTELQDEIDNLPQQYKMFAQSPDVRKRILDNLVITELILQEAEKEGMLKNAETKKKIEEYENSMKGELEAQILALKRQKENVAKLAKREIVIKQIFEGKDYKDISVTDAEIAQSYARYAEGMKRNDPNAKVEKLADIKDSVRLSIAREKWVESLKTNAKITVNEAAAGTAAMPPAAGGNIQIQPQAAGGK